MVKIIMGEIKTKEVYLMVIGKNDSETQILAEDVKQELLEKVGNCQITIGKVTNKVLSIIRRHGGKEYLFIRYGEYERLSLESIKNMEYYASLITVILFLDIDTEQNRKANLEKTLLRSGFSSDLLNFS